jgi:hypothetical protein
MNQTNQAETIYALKHMDIKVEFFIKGMQKFSQNEVCKAKAEK